MNVSLIAGGDEDLWRLSPIPLEGLRNLSMIPQRLILQMSHCCPALLRCFCWCLLFALSTTQLPAQDSPSPTKHPDLTNLSLEELTKLEVTSVSKNPEKYTQTAAAVTVITQEDIRRSGATNIPDILRLVPGVEVAQIDSDKWSIGIRGFGSRLSRSVLVLIDGRSVYTPLFSGVYWEVQDTLIEDIERIEVIRGPGGTIWGSNAVNGVINIITKSSKDTHGMLVSTGGGNVDQGFGNFRVGAGKGKSFDYRVYGKGFTRGPQFHLDHRQFDDWRSGQIGFRTDSTLSDHDTLTIQGDAYKIVAGQKVGVSTYSPPALVNVEENGDFAGENLVGRWRHALHSGSDIQVQAYYDRTDRRDVNFREIRNTFDVDFIHHLTFSRHDFTWGLGARVSPSQFFQTVATVDFLPHHQTYSLYSGFVQDEIAVVPDRISFIVGTKLEHNSFSGFSVQPSGRALWTFRPHQTLWGAVTRAVRTPSRIEEGFELTALAQPALPAYLRLIGDGHFSPEQMIGYEMGYRGSFHHNFFLDVASFYDQHDNLLSIESGSLFAESSPSPTHLILPLFLRNGVRAAITGIEIAPVWEPRKGWQLQGSYSFLHLDAKDKPRSNDVSTVRQLEGNSPHHLVTIRSSVDLPKGFEMDLTYRYVSALPGQHVRAYSTGDARLGFRLGQGIELSLGGRNLFQPHHAEFGGDPGGLVEIRRSAYAKITWHTQR